MRKLILLVVLISSSAFAGWSTGPSGAFHWTKEICEKAEAARCYFVDDNQDRTVTKIQGDRLVVDLEKALEKEAEQSKADQEKAQKKEACAEYKKALKEMELSESAIQKSYEVVTRNILGMIQFCE